MFLFIYSCTVIIYLLSNLYFFIINFIFVNKGYHIRVHVSDVASYINPNSIFFNLAISRMTSVYFPEQTFHIFPERLVDEMSIHPGFYYFLLFFIINID